MATKSKFPFTVTTCKYPWLKTIEEENIEVKKDKKKNVKIRAAAKDNKKIINPIFKELINIVDDKYWEEAFESFAIGKFPKCIQYKNNTITLKIGNNIEEQELNPENPEEFLEQFLHFMNTKAEIFSAKDEKRNKDLMDEEVKNFQNTKIKSWSKVTKHAHRNRLIYEYIKKYADDLKDKNEPELTKEQSDDLFNCIKIGTISKFLDNDKIVIEDEKIVHIYGIIRKKNGFFKLDTEGYKLKNKNRKNDKDIDSNTVTKYDTYTKTINTISKNSSSFEKNTTVNFDSIWKKYLENTRNKIIKKKKN